MSENSKSEQIGERELIYADEFKRLIREHPGIIKSFLELDRKIKEKKDSEDLSIGDTFQDGELSITIIDKRGNSKKNDNTPPNVYYMKTTIGDEIFFIKNIPGNYLAEDISGGSKEFISLREAKKCLSGLTGIEVIDFQLGYEDVTNNRTYFVSKWRDAENLAQYLNRATKLDKEKLRNRVGKIQETLGDNFLDVYDHNMLYDEDADQIIVFDTHLRK